VALQSSLVAKIWLLLEEQKQLEIETVCVFPAAHAQISIHTKSM
jgi:hypothetical protein